jgi:hypothetical protein
VALLNLPAAVSQAGCGAAAAAAATHMTGNRDAQLGFASHLSTTQQNLTH